MTTERPTFSPFWHRVRATRPRLRPQVQITRQLYRGRRWHVVHDPTSNQFYRLNPVAYEFICGLDGTRDVDTAWKASLTRFGDMAPTQNEVIQLITQLYNANLLSVESSPETEQLLHRGRERMKKKAVQQAIGIMYLKIRLLNPDRMLTAIEPVLRPLLNRWGFLAWCVLVAYALTRLIPRWDELVKGFDQVMAPANLWLVPVVYVIAKLIHETGHGVICKRFGGQVPEFGVMLLVLFPSPYVDASACWAFKDKWKRVAVGAGGMLFELALAAIAALVWLGAEPGTIVRQMAYNVMLTAGVATVLFNANPLMRFDGYYMLSDLIEVPNLAQRSQKMLQHLAQKWLYRLKNLTPPSGERGEQAILIVYGVLSMAYRIFLFITITLFVMGSFFGLGLVLAIWTAAAWFVLPTAKFIHWLASSPQLHDRRQRTILASLAAIGVVAGVLGWIPLPDRRRAEGVIDSTTDTGVFAGADGFVEKVHKRPGDAVKQGEPIVTLINDDLIQRRAGALAELEEFGVQERYARSQGQPAAEQVARERIAVALGSVAELDRQLAALVVRAPADGVVVGRDPERLMGVYVQKGNALAQVVDPSRVRVSASLDQRQAAWLFELPEDAYAVDIRLSSDLDTIMKGKNVRPIDAGQRELPSTALAFGGGGQVETDAEDKSGLVSKRPRFTVRIDAEDPAALAEAAAPGERVHLRFRLPHKPLLAQWWDRLRKEVQGRVNL